MLKRTIVFIVCLLGTASISFADTIYLKSGNKIEGKIIQQTNNMVKIDISGVTITYYMDEIERIEGGEGAQAPAVSTPGAAVTAPAVTARPASPSVSTAAGKPSKELVIRYLDLSGTTSTLDQMFQEMINNSSPQDAGRLRQAYDLDEIVEILVPVYQKYFTEDDMRKLVTFYQSPVARKLNDTTPMIVKDTLDAAMLYFRTKLPLQSAPGVSSGQTP